MEVTSTLRSNFWGEWGGRGMQGQPCARGQPLDLALEVPPPWKPQPRARLLHSPPRPAMPPPRTPGSSQRVLHTLSPHLLHRVRLVNRKRPINGRCSLVTGERTQAVESGQLPPPRSPVTSGDLEAAPAAHSFLVRTRRGTTAAQGRGKGQKPGERRAGTRYAPEKG